MALARGIAVMDRARSQVGHAPGITNFAESVSYPIQLARPSFKATVSACEPGSSPCTARDRLRSAVETSDLQHRARVWYAAAQEIRVTRSP